MMTATEYLVWLAALKRAGRVAIWRATSSRPSPTRMYDAVVVKATSGRVTVEGRTGSRIVFNRQDGMEVMKKGKRYRWIQPRKELDNIQTEENQKCLSLLANSAGDEDGQAMPPSAT